MAVKNDTGIAKRAAALTHHGHGGTTSKLSHNNSSVAMHPTERIATPRRLRTALILPPMAVVASADEPSFSGKAPHALHRLNGGMVGRPVPTAAWSGVPTAAWSGVPTAAREDVPMSAFG